MSHASRTAYLADLIDDLTGLYLAQAPICASLPRPRRPGKAPCISKMPSATGKSAAPTSTGQFEQAAFSPSPIPIVAPNELDLPEDN
jgi:hypothetical protein